MGFMSLDRLPVRQRRNCSDQVVAQSLASDMTGPLCQQRNSQGEPHLG